MWNADQGPLAWARRALGLGGASAPAATDDAPAQEAEPAAPAVEPEEPAAPARRWIDDDALLGQLAGDRELLAELARLFVQERDRRLVALEGALSAGDAGEVGRAAHGIKSGLTNFCAPEAVALAASIEHAGRDGELSGVPAALAELKVCMQEMEAELDRLGGAA